MQGLIIYWHCTVDPMLQLQQRQLTFFIQVVKSSSVEMKDKKETHLMNHFIFLSPIPIYVPSIFIKKYIMGICKPANMKTNSPPPTPNSLLHLNIKLFIMMSIALNLVDFFRDCTPCASSHLSNTR